MPVHANHQSPPIHSKGFPSSNFRNPPWWHRRSRLERTLCGVTVISLIMLVGMAVALAVVGYHYQESLNTRHHLRYPTGGARMGTEDNSLLDHEACLTPGCVKAAAVLLENMDTRADPCDDFYQFACGGWVSKQIIPDDKSHVSTFELLQDALDEKLRGMVEKEASPTDPHFVNMLKDLYSSCMNLSAIEAASSRPLQEVLSTFGGWPVVAGDSWDLSAFDWMDTLILFRRHGFNLNILMLVSVSIDSRNNSKYVIGLDQTSFGMPDRKYLLKGINDTNVRAYFKLMVDSAVLLGASRTSAEEEMKEALLFEIQLANFSLPREERRNVSKLYNKMSLTDLFTLAPTIDWRLYFNLLLKDPIPDSEPIVVYVPDYVRNLSSLLDRTDKRVVANYMLWRVVRESISRLSKPWQDLKQEYISVIEGKTRKEPRWKTCIVDVSESMSTAIASLYVKSHFQKDSKNLAMEILKYIHKEFQKMLQELEWMDVETKSKATEKVNTIRPFIGFPDELLSEQNLEKYHEKLTITKTSYYNNKRNLNTWVTDYFFSRLRKPNIKGDWKKHTKVAEVNAFYSPLENSIDIPAGILQGIFFGKDKPHYLNFGAIGFVIGHEITHGFDDRGRQYDKDGNNKNWWDTSTDLKFRQKAQCIIDQYTNYTVPEINMKINGVITQGENIADNGGIKEAFKAYQSWVRDHGQEKPLPGLPYTPNQLFWISTASVWCGKLRPEALTLRLLSDSHSPPIYRVIGPLSNSPEFTQEFQCPLGSVMNPRMKCQVW